MQFSGARQVVKGHSDHLFCSAVIIAFHQSLTLSVWASGITNLMRPVSGKKALILPSSQPLIRAEPIKY